MGALLQDWSLLASKGVVGAHQKLLAAQRISRVETAPNYYAVLGVEKSAPTVAIRSAFRCFNDSPVPAQHQITAVRCMLGRRADYAHLSCPAQCILVSPQHAMPAEHLPSRYVHADSHCALTLLSKTMLSYNLLAHYLVNIHA